MKILNKCFKIVPLFVVFAFAGFGQSSLQEARVLRSRLEKLEIANERLTSESRRLRSDVVGKFDGLNRTIDELKVQIESNDKLIQKLTDQLAGRIEASENDSNHRYRNLDGAVSRNAKSTTIGGVLLVGFLGLFFLFIRRRSAADKDELDGRIQRTRETLEQEDLKLDEKLAGLLVECLEVKSRVNGDRDSSSTVLDHSLALNVADEMVRIEKNLSRFDAADGRLKPIQKAIERLRDNLMISGYEVVPLLNRAFEEGMNVEVINFTTDSELPHGTKVISRMIRPQVNFEGVLIQRAQVTVSQNLSDR